MSRHRVRSPRLLAVAAAMVVASLAGCGDDDGGGDEPSPGTTMPYVGGTGGVRDSTGRSGGVINNQPTTPAVNNAPPGDDGTG